jgi:carboxymethylenebutenolidase
MSPPSIQVPSEDGNVPTAALGPLDGSASGGVFVVPSIFGPAPDLLDFLSELSDRVLVAVPDPFWRVGGGVVPYDQHEAAIGRLQGFDLRRCIADLSAVLDWTRERVRGPTVGVGICFGGPFVLRFASEERLDGVVTWHGSRMQDHLERAGRIRCPLRLHFGDADAMSPPEVIETIRGAFTDHPDVDIVVHPGVDHGYSHDGAAWDEKAARAGLDAVSGLLS